MTLIAPGELIFSSEDGWKIFCQDAGNGEVDYALFHHDEFYCRTPTQDIANDVIGAICFSSNMRNAEKREKLIREDERKKTMDEFGILHGDDAKRLEEYMNSPPQPLTEMQKELFRQAIKLSKVI